MRASWTRLGSVAPGDLASARLQLHHAAQIVSAVGLTHLPHAADDSHTNLEWLPAFESFEGGLVDGPRPFRAAICPGDLNLRLLDGSGREARRLPLSGKTLDEGYVWMAEAIAAESTMPMKPLVRPSYELPEHDIAGGSRFSEPMDSFREVGRWYGDAASLLGVLMKEFSDASPVRCWPHHFDVAMLLTVGPEKTIGMGLSPGDQTYPEPYWYVTPYPYPQPLPRESLPDLPGGGRWHTEGFFAAVLTGSDLLAGRPEGPQQRDCSEEFLRSALAACRSLI